MKTADGKQTALLPEMNIFGNRARIFIVIFTATWLLAEERRPGTAKNTCVFQVWIYCGITNAGRNVLP